MSELLPYLRLLAERGPGIASRELASRFFREPPITSIRRVMDVCEQAGARFTFFIVGVSAKDNPLIIEEILERGHEIACHGYRHLRFPLLSDEEIRRDLEQALMLFDNQFNYKLVGFRAPYLEMNDAVYDALREFGFTYSSSRMGEGGPSVHPSGIVEIPIVVDDWSVLIKQNRGVSGLDTELQQHKKNQSCMLLHPWRVGQTKYIQALQNVTSSSAGSHVFPNMRDGLETDNAVFLTGDIGEFGLLEIARRVIVGGGS